MNRAKTRARKALDDRLTPLRDSDRLAVPPKGWVRAIRDAIGMSGPQLAARMGVKPQSVVDLEKSEAGETVQLATLRRAADALDCRLVYALVPNEPLETRVRKRARAIALRHLGGIAHSMAMEDQAVKDDDLEARIDRFITETLRDRDLWEPDPETRA